MAVLSQSVLTWSRIASISMSVIISITMAEMLLQTVSPAVGSDMEHMTLEGALIAAVVVLWRALSAKDSQLVESTRAVTMALAASATSNAELRKIIEESIAVKQQLTESLDLLRTRLGNISVRVGGDLVS